jgi:hypothetical protein
MAFVAPVIVATISGGLLYGVYQYFGSSPITVEEKKTVITYISDQHQIRPELLEEIKNFSPKKLSPISSTNFSTTVNITVPQILATRRSLKKTSPTEKKIVASDTHDQLLFSTFDQVRKRRNNSPINDVPSADETSDANTLSIFHEHSM